MDKRISVLYSIVALVLLGMAVFIFFSPEDRLDNTLALSQRQACLVAFFYDRFAGMNITYLVS